MSGERRAEIGISLAVRQSEAAAFQGAGRQLLGPTAAAPVDKEKSNDHVRGSSHRRTCTTPPML